MNISENSWPIATKYHLGGGKAALGFGPDRIPLQRIAPIGL